jgi:hypothetical protein
MDARVIVDSALDSDVGEADGSTASDATVSDGGCGMPGFSPVYHPAVPGSGACMPAEIASFQTACLDNGNRSGTNVTPACAACLYTANPNASASWGVVLAQPQFLELNIDACEELRGSEAPCGVKRQAQLECEQAACRASSVDLSTFVSCQTKVDTGACSCYVAPADFACAGPHSPCTLAQYATFDDAFQALALIACGP